MFCMKKAVEGILQRVTLKEQVYHYLKKAIINGELKTGEIYSEQMFATRLNISRTPVREAVLQLSQENMLDVYNNRGIMVRPLLFDEIQKIIQARVAIEGYSVRYLTQNIHIEEAQEILISLDTCLILEKNALNKEQNFYDFMQADMDFHGLIVHFTENEYLINSIQMMRSRIEKATVNSLKQGNRMAVAMEEHRALLLHIKSGDENKAYQSFAHHMKNTEDIMKYCDLD